MRLHTDRPDEVEAAMYRAVRALSGVYVEKMERHGSRSRAAAIELKLSGTNNRQANPGTYWHTRGTSEQAATWDEWGVVLQAAFDADPEMTSTYYRSREDYEWQTRSRFVDFHDWPLGLPYDTHQTHRWSFDPDRGLSSCKDCSAERSHPLPVRS